MQEIDVCEQDSVNRTSYSVNLHRWKPGPHVSHGYKRITTPDLAAEFHVWGCEFTPQRIDYYFDERLVQSLDATVIPHGPQNIWLTSVAAPLGGTKSVDDSKLPAFAEFDYVRCFTKAVSPETNEPCATFAGQRSAKSRPYDRRKLAAIDVTKRSKGIPASRGRHASTKSRLSSF